MVGGNIYGTLIEGGTYGIYADSSSSVEIGGNIITNSGTVNGSIYGLYIAGGSAAIETDATATVTITGNTITNSGTVSGSIYAGTGDDTVIMQSGPDSIGGSIDGEDGNDTIIYSGGIWTQGDLKVVNFEEEKVDATGELTLKGNWDIGTDSAQVNGGVLHIADSLTAGALLINAGVASIDGTAVVDSSIVIGSLQVSGSLNSDVLDIAFGSFATIAAFGTVTADATDIAGTMNLDGRLNSDNVVLTATGSLSGSGTISGNLSNAGTISPGNSIGQITVNGDYYGRGELIMEVDFSSSSADCLVVSGNLNADETVYVVDIAEEQSLAADEIIIVDAANDNDRSDETFVLDPASRYNGQSNLGRWAGSPYVWCLRASGNTWVLGNAYEVGGYESPAVETSPEVSYKPAVVSEIPAYISLPTFTYEVVVNKFDTLHQRLGELRRNADGDVQGLLVAPSGMDAASSADVDGQPLHGWIRSVYAGFDFDDDENFDLDGRFGIGEIGFDYRLTPDGHNTIFTGFFSSMINGDFTNSGRGNTYGALYEADTDMRGLSAGIYTTWFHTNGIYADFVFDCMELDADIRAVDHFTTDGKMIGGSVEVGRQITVHPMLLIEPQVQMKIVHVAWDGFFDGWNDVSFAGHTYVTGRVGLRGGCTGMFANGSVVEPWIYIGIQKEFNGSPDITYVQFYGDAGYSSDFADYISCRVDAGLRLCW